MNPVAPYSSSSQFSGPRFSGIFNRRKQKKKKPEKDSLENRAFEKVKGLEAQKNDTIKPAIYRTLAKLHLPGFRQKHDAEEQRLVNGELQTRLETLLKEKNWPKTGGIQSVFWQAYHLPATLLKKADGDPLAGPAYQNLVETAYLPLIASLDSPKEWRTVNWIATSAGNDHATLFQQLRAVKTSNPAHWQTLIRLSGWYHLILKSTFFHPSTVSAGDLSAPSVNIRREAYHYEKDRFVNDVIIPYIQSSVTALADTPEPVADYAQALLFPALKTYAENHPPVRLIATNNQQSGGKQSGGHPQGFLALRKTAAELLWHLLVLDSDLRGIPLESTLGDSLAAISDALRPPETPISVTAPDLLVSHDDLDAVIPDEVAADADAVNNR